MSSPLNGCSACGCDFRSLTLFDAHRVGVNAYTYSEGVAMEPMREDGRRCLSAVEMLGRDWEQDAKGRWFDPAAVEAARRHFSAAQSDAEATEALAATAKTEALIGA